LPAGALPISSNAAPPITQFIRTILVSLPGTIAQLHTANLERN
jgi:hypothetical protein